MGKTLMSSVCSRLWRLCRLCRLCKLCELCKLLNDRLWLATGVLSEVLSGVLPDVLFGVLLLFDARLWRIIEHRWEILGGRLLVDHCGVFLSERVLDAVEASSTGPAPGVLKGIQSWGVTQASNFIPTLVASTRSCQGPQRRQQEVRVLLSSFLKNA